jgi:hypothetical protein
MDCPDAAHTRPDGLSDATVEALGKLSEAFEVIEQARGMLYGFHRMIGMADLSAGEAVEQLRAAGHEDFDSGYYADFQRFDREAREELVQGKRHLFEAEMKEARRSAGRRHHEAQPPERR